MALKRRMPAVHPGEILFHEVMGDTDMTITQGAKLLGISRKQLSEIVNGTASITPEMALRIEKVFKIEADLWLRLQANYDLWHADNSNKLDDLKPLPGKKPKIRSI